MGRTFIIFVTLLTLFIIGCDSTENDEIENNINNINNTNNVNNINNTNNANNLNNNNNQEPNPAWFEPDPEGRITEGNLLGYSPEMVIITSNELSGEWQQYAAMRTSQGLSTIVEIMETIIQDFEGRDDAEKLRNYLMKMVEDHGVKYALFGGDKEHVPFRRVDNSIFIDTNYTANGPSQVYFANLEVDFDGDGDSQFGEMDDDLSLEQIRLSTLAVGRVPSGNLNEVNNYYNKYVTYSNGVYGRTTHTLLLSDVATSIPLIGDIDGAEGVEMTYDKYFPQEFKDNVAKLYSTEQGCESYGATMGTPASINESLEDGYSMIFHNGHGSHYSLTSQMNSDFISGLANQLPSVLVSCSCLSGNFADVGNSNIADDWESQTVENDSSGEIYINGAHGGVAYVGNTASGLGAFGGSQFLHAFYDGLFEKGLTSIGNAFNYGRLNMRDTDWTVPLIPMDMTDDSEWWTQHVVILFGDPSLVIHKTPLESLSISLPETYGPGYNELQLTVTDSSGNPVSGATVSLFKVDDFYIAATTDSMGIASFTFMPYQPELIHVGITKENFLPKNTTMEPIL
jgi:Peptidase family C25